MLPLTVVGSMSRASPSSRRPPVQKLRIRYAKRGRLRFSSHRDFSRALERALVRAEVPMAFSSGFNPHPKISYAGAAPTGAASEAEYVEIGLTGVLRPRGGPPALDAALPDGLDVLEVVVAARGTLADRLEAAGGGCGCPGCAAGRGRRRSRVPGGRRGRRSSG